MEALHCCLNARVDEDEGAARGSGFLQLVSYLPVSWSATLEVDELASEALTQLLLRPQRKDEAVV